MRSPGSRQDSVVNVDLGMGRLNVYQPHLHLLTCALYPPLPLSLPLAEPRHDSQCHHIPHKDRREGRVACVQPTLGDLLLVQGYLRTTHSARVPCPTGRVRVWSSFCGGHTIQGFQGPCHACHESWSMPCIMVNGTDHVWIR